MTRRRGYAVAAAALGAGLTLLAASRGWADPAVPGGGAPPRPRQPRTGTDMLPWLPAVALVALAGAGALLATRGASRMLVGGVLVLAGAAIAAGAAPAVTDGAGIRWPVLAAVGAVLVIDAGLLTVRKGRSWPTMGARYERAPAAATTAPGAPAATAPGTPAATASGTPATTAAGTEAAMWDALDRGEDPTR